MLALQAEIRARVGGAGRADDAPMQQPQRANHDSLTKRMYDKAWRRAESDDATLSPPGVAAGSALAGLVLPKMQELLAEGGADLLHAGDAAKAAALDLLDHEFKVWQRGLRKTDDGEVMLAKIMAEVVRMVGSMHSDNMAASKVLIARLDQGHKEVGQVLRGQAALLVGELVSEAKDKLNARHGWKSAEVTRKLEGARMAARSEAQAEFAAALKAAHEKIESLSRRLVCAEEALQRSSPVQVSHVPAKQTAEYLALLEERDKLARLLEQLETMLREETMQREAMEGQLQLRDDNERELRALRGKLEIERQAREAAIGRMQSLEQMLGNQGASEARAAAEDRRRKREVKQAAGMAAEAQRLKQMAQDDEMEREVRKSSVDSAAELAALRAQLAQALQDADEAALEASRWKAEMLLNSEANIRGGNTNLNFPSGQLKGHRRRAVDPALAHPLFRTSLTANLSRVLSPDTSSGDAWRDPTSRANDNAWAEEDNGHATSRILASLGVGTRRSSSNRPRSSNGHHGHRHISSSRRASWASKLNAGLSTSTSTSTGTATSNSGASERVPSVFAHATSSVLYRVFSQDTHG